MSNLPVELISYRGLMKSFDDIKRGNFMNHNRNDENAKFTPNALKQIKNLFVFTVFCTINIIEWILFKLMSCYDNYVYTSLKENFTPIVKSIPSQISLRNSKTVVKINSNIITVLRTMLLIPIAWCLKHHLSVAACITVLTHAFFSHFDGIVARVHGYMYPHQENQLFNRFLIAFSNKVVNLLTLIAILLLVNFETCNIYQIIVFCAIIYAVIAYDLLIGIVHVQTYFEAKLIKEKSYLAIKASNQWKLKTKLESAGIAALCLASDQSYENPIFNSWGIFGSVLLVFTVRMAHKSLEYELLTQKSFEEESKTQNNALNTAKVLQNSSSADNLLTLLYERAKLRPIKEKNETDSILNDLNIGIVDLSNAKNDSGLSGRANSLTPIKESIQEAESNLSFQDCNNELLTNQPVIFNQNDEDDDEIETTENHKANSYIRHMSVPSIRTDNRVDKVYTIGCFDLFHYGHVRLIERMRTIGKKVIIGVHDSRSIYKLKNRVPVDSTEKRMFNVKQHADEVFCISSTDPSNYILCVVHLEHGETALYIRGDDMPNFPARDVVEKLMPIKFLPYTQGVSSTQLRKEKFSHIRADDEEYLENNS